MFSQIVAALVAVYNAIKNNSGISAIIAAVIAVIAIFNSQIGGALASVWSGIASLFSI